MKKIEHKKINGVYKVFFENKWLSFHELAQTPEAVEKGLTAANLRHRVNGNYRTYKKMFRAKQEYKIKDDESWLKEGCTPEQWEALKTGNNQALLNLKEA